MLLTHSPSLPPDLPLPGVAALSQAQWRHREGRAADRPLWWGKMFFLEFKESFLFHSQESSHKPCAVPGLCPGLPRG